MTHVAELLDLSKLKEKKEYDKTESISTETAGVINWLFKELRSNFTAFKQAWPTQEVYQAAKKVWLKAFMLAGINKIEQIQYGLNRCYLLEKPFVPSPGEFIAWCSPRPEDIGLPRLDEAYAISTHMNRQFSDYKPTCQNTYSVIKHAISQIGSSEYRGMKADKAYKTFEHYYAIACKQFMQGDLKPIPKVLAETPEDHPADKERADEARRKCMDELRRIGLPIGVTN